MRILFMSICLIFSLTLVNLPLVHSETQDDEQVVAEINGDKILLEVFEARVKDWERAMNKPMKRAEKMTLLGEMIDSVIINQEALKEGYDKRPDVVASFEQAKRDIAARAYTTAEVTDKLSYTEDDLRKYYDENIERFEPVFRSAQIVVVNKKNREDEDVTDEAQKLANEIKGRLAKGEFVRDFFFDTIRENESLLLLDRTFFNKPKNYFSESDNPLIDEIFKMEKGALVVRDYPNGFVVIRVDDEIQLNKDVFEAQKNKVEVEFQRLLWKSKFRELMEKLRKDKEVKVHEELIP